MDLSVEISKYPLNENYIPVIKDFIDRLNTHPHITVLTNTMSTQIFGEFDAVMHAISTEMKKSFSQDIKQVMVMKFINSDLRPQ
ncbi:MAG: hypothetical protein ACI9N1_000511 [Flavobacteriales bacterium]|jgi:uncharacterized protein YqgV (UPF0045/DUF77 family)